MKNRHRNTTVIVVLGQWERKNCSRKRSSWQNFTPRASVKSDKSGGKRDQTVNERPTAKVFAHPSFQFDLLLISQRHAVNGKGGKREPLRRPNATEWGSISIGVHRVRADICTIKDQMQAAEADRGRQTKLETIFILQQNSD